MTVMGLMTQVLSHTCKVFDNSITYLFIEAPKFTKQEFELETPLECWMYVLTNLTQLKEIPVTLREDPIFKEFFMVAELLQMTHEEREAYLVSLKERWDEYSLKETAMEEGGRNRQLSIGRALKAMDISADVIFKSTGLSLEEINQL